MIGKKQLIVALDTTDWQLVNRVVHSLEDMVFMYKVGLELFSQFGPEIVFYLQKKNKKVFLDLKLHDIPNTLKRVARVIVNMKVSMFTIHISSGARAMEELVSAVQEEAALKNVSGPRVLGVTVLTSFDNFSWKKLGMSKSIEDTVQDHAVLAEKCGLDGVVCSPREISLLRKICRPDFIIASPGIRPAGFACEDQARSMTPGEAVRQGADFVVVGRPIARASHPDVVVKSIYRELSSVE